MFCMREINLFLISNCHVVFENNKKCFRNFVGLEILKGTDKRKFIGYEKNDLS